MDNQFNPIDDLHVECTITGFFFTNQHGDADASLPVHDEDRAEGYHLKGDERKAVGAMVSQVGVNQAFLNQQGNNK